MTERIFARVLFASRRLLAPFHAALGIGIVVLLVDLLQELADFALPMWDATESRVVPGVLTRADLALRASLLIIVTFSGHETFVSKIDRADHRDRPAWMGTIGFTGLTLKLVPSIVALSAIAPLKALMDLKAMRDRDPSWLIGIHMVVGVAGLLMAPTDRITAGHHEW